MPINEPNHQDLKIWAWITLGKLVLVAAIIAFFAFAAFQEDVPRVDQEALAKTWPTPEAQRGSDAWAIKHWGKK